MTFAIALLRVSTDKQFEHGDSIETQKLKIDRAAERNGHEIVRYFAEHYSGRKTQRGTIEEMIDFLAERKDDIGAVYICQIDRFTRGGSDAYLHLRKRLYGLGVELVDAYGVIQKRRNLLEHTGFSYEWSERSSSELAEVLLAEQAKAEATDILTRTIGQQIKLAGEGYQTRDPNYGYRNVKTITPDGRKRTIMEPNPDEAVFIQEMYKLRASGSLTDQEICDKLNAMGYRSRITTKRDKRTRQPIGQQGAKPLNPKQLQRYLARPIYCGYRIEKWTHNQPVKVPFEPLVSIDLFNRANRGKIEIKAHKNGKTSVVYDVQDYKLHVSKEDFRLRHGVACPKCGKPFLASYAKSKSGKRHGYYHCSRGHPYIGIPKDEFESTVGCYLKSLEAKPGFMGMFREVVREVWIDKHRDNERERSAIRDHIDALKTRGENCFVKYEAAQSPIILERLEKQIEEIQASIEKAENQLSDHDLSEDQIQAFFEIAKSLIEHPEKHIFDSDTEQEFMTRWRFVFPSAPSWTEIENGTPAISLLYRLSGQSHKGKRQLASQLSAEWNTFVECVEYILQNFGD